MIDTPIVRFIEKASERLPTYDEASDALLFAARKGASQLVQATRLSLLRPRVADQVGASASLLRATGWVKLKPSPNFLSAGSDNWARFTEPQITGGWAHYLSDRRQLARCQAAFDAAWRGHATSPPILKRAESISAESGRIDILIIGEDEDEDRYCVCIEAKFGHFLTNQLRSYETYLSEICGIEDNRRALVIIAAEMRRDIALQLGHQDNAWSFMTWKDWLIAYDNALPSEADDDSFCRFRNTTLHRAHLELRK